MASWAIYPPLDATYPAGLSPAVIQGELRSRLGYQGVTVTDAIEAGALATFNAAVQRMTALRACPALTRRPAPTPWPAAAACPR